MARAGAKAFATVLSGAPQLQKTIAGAQQAQRVEGRAQAGEERAIAGEGRAAGRFQMEKDTFNRLKEQMETDKNYIENTIKEIKDNPQLSQYADQFDKANYSNDIKGKTKLTTDVAMLMYMAKNPKAKKLGVAPDINVYKTKTMFDDEVKRAETGQQEKVGMETLTGLKAGAPSRRLAPGEEGPPEFPAAEQAGREARAALPGGRAPTREEAGGVAFEQGAGKDVSQTVAGAFQPGIKPVEQARLDAQKAKQQALQRYRNLKQGNKEGLKFKDVGRLLSTFQSLKERTEKTIFDPLTSDFIDNPEIKEIDTIVKDLTTLYKQLRTKEGPTSINEPAAAPAVDLKSKFDAFKAGRPQ